MAAQDFDHLGEVIFEIVRLGEYQRVAAIHVESGTEVVVQAPAAAALSDVRKLALRKLERALHPSSDAPPTTTAKRGKIV